MTPRCSGPSYPVFNLLDPPDALLQNSEVMGRVLAVWQARGERPDPPPEGPTHDEMVRILADAELKEISHVSRSARPDHA